MSLLVICKTLSLFVNTLTVDDKYSVRNIENLPQPIQMELSKKQNFFPQFVAALLKSPSNLKHFEKKDEPHS